MAGQRHHTTTAGFPKGALSWRAARQSIGRCRPMGEHPVGGPEVALPLVRGCPEGRRIAVLWSQGGTGAADAAPVRASGRSPQKNFGAEDTTRSRVRGLPGEGGA
jgi:hypothetical protein